jgi:serine/threonine protein kinase
VNFALLTLPEGSRIRNCVVERRLGKGGFGITYLATEYATTEAGEELGPVLRKVAIKEFFPQGIAWRDNGHTVSPTPTVEGAPEAFQNGLRAFYKEAQAIAGLDHENVIRLLSVFQSNGTAYFIMPYIRGESLRGLLRREGSLSEERARRLLLPVLDGLAHAHARGILHRDLKPDNVMIREDDGRAILIDFGTARSQTASDTTRYTRLTDLVAFTPGYAALEQYSRAASENRHGPWTDVYSFGAVLYEAVTGKAPPESALRAAEAGGGHPDPLQPASALLRDVPGYGRGFLLAIDWALELAAKDRPQDLRAFRAALDGRSMPPEATLARLEAQGTSVEPLTVGMPAGPTVFVPPAAATFGPAVTAPPAPTGPGISPPLTGLPTAPVFPPRRIAPAAMAGAAMLLGLAAAAIAVISHFRAAPAHPPAVAAGLALSPSLTAPAPAGSAGADAALQKTRDDTDALLQRAATLVAQNHGHPGEVLRAARDAFDAAEGVRAQGQAAAAAGGYAQAADAARAAVRQYLDANIEHYRKIAQGEIATNHLHSAQAALDAARNLKREEDNFR